MEDLEPAIVTAALFEGGLDFRLIADQVQLRDGWVGLKRQPDPIDDDPAPVVATHDIHYNSHKSKERRRKEAGCALET